MNKRKRQTIQWTKEGQTIQWKKEEGQTTQWIKEEGQTIQWTKEKDKHTMNKRKKTNKGWQNKTDIFFNNDKMKQV